MLLSRIFLWHSGSAKALAVVYCRAWGAGRSGRLSIVNQIKFHPPIELRTLFLGRRELQVAQILKAKMF